MNTLSFSTLREANVKRCEQVFHPLNSWTPTDWACAMAGEAGECCNAVKKLRRHDDGTNTAKDPASKQACIVEIAKELADTVIYCDLLAARLGIDLGSAVIDKFNVVSDRMKSEVTLSATTQRLFTAEQVRPLVEALTRINEISVIDEDMGCAVNWAGDALVHARDCGMMGDKP